MSTSVRIGVLRDGIVRRAHDPARDRTSRGVLAGEAARESPPAALETLAIAIRTYAVANVGRHRADGFDLCDQTHCQVLRQTMAVDRSGGVGHGRPDAARPRRSAGRDLLQRVLRRPDGGAVRGLAGRRRSRVPSVARRRGMRRRARLERRGRGRRLAARAAGGRVSRPTGRETCGSSAATVSGRAGRVLIDGLSRARSRARTCGWRSARRRLQKRGLRRQAAGRRATASRGAGTATAWACA